MGQHCKSKAFAILKAYNFKIKREVLFDLENNYSGEQLLFSNADSIWDLLLQRPDPQLV